MNDIIIAVGTSTYAMKAKRLLLREGIESKVVRITPGRHNEGCSHGIELNESNLYDAAAVLRTNGIAYSIYKDKNDIS